MSVKSFHSSYFASLPPATIFCCYKKKLTLNLLSPSSNIYIFQSKISQGAVYLPTANLLGFPTINKAERWVPDLPNARRGSVWCVRGAKHQWVSLACYLYAQRRRQGIIHYLSAGIAATCLDFILKNSQDFPGGTGDVAERSSRYLGTVFKFLPAFTVSNL